ncbi:MAG TPA: YjgN family protein [Steroidobacteraceae bacterium]|nr:YjgN family protein [Steroidobacteraceae bacterium]
MGTDGEIDYRRYSRAALEDALQRIDRARYPLNYQRLVAELERRRSEEAAAAASVPAATRYRPEFNARGEEYFRIWIVNLALTIVTLGIYSAWAKVRKLRYFYSSTTLAGSAFGYHGDPVRILRGRIIAAALAAAYFGASRISPIGTLVMLAVIGLAWPWLLVKSRMFTMRVTSWRGLRFDFAPDYAGAYRVILGWGALGIVSLGLLMPRFLCERYRFVITRGRYGSTPFECNPSVGRFYKTMFATIGLGLAMAVVLFMPMSLLLVAVAKAASVSPAVMQVVSTATVGVLYAVMLSTIHGYTQSRNLNEVFGKTELGPHRFVSSLGATDLAGIYLGNLFLIVVTLGLYTPWAQIRLARYRLECIELEVHGSLDAFAAAAAAPVPAAAGEEIGSFFDLDFGF